MNTILYIEDDADSRRLLLRTLSHAGFNVLEAETGLQGIDLARRKQPDLILTDLNLPDLSGNELATLLRSDQQFETTPIVALTAHGDSAYHRALAAGITGFLNKPVEVDLLVEYINFYMSGGHDAIDEETLHSAQVDYTRDVVSRLERRIRELEEANASLKRMDSIKENFIQITAHELRTPLTLVYGYTRLLEEHPPFEQFIRQDDTVQQLLHGLTDSVERMQSMVEEVLIMSRVMTQKVDLTLSPTNLGQIVESVLAEYADSLSERQIKVEFDKDQWPHQMKADYSLLHMALGNLISNAIKFTPNGGQIRLAAQTYDKQVGFAVHDTGIGIDPAEQDKIFEQFHTLGDTKLHSTSKTAYMGGGLGLGLPICRGIIEAHGGIIWVESAGRDDANCPGSSFYVSMPLTVERST